jgi:hypothetical protein
VQLSPHVKIKLLAAQSMKRTLGEIDQLVCGASTAIKNDISIVEAN